MDPLVVGTAVPAVSWAVSGAALLVRRRAVPTGVLLLLGGLVGTGGAALLAADERSAGVRLLLVGAMLLLPTALMVYPSPRWRHPADVVAIALMVGCGVVGAGYASWQVTPFAATAQVSLLLVHTWWRIEVTRDHERRALLWLALSVSVAAVAYFFATFSVEGSASLAVPELALVVFAVVGPAMSVGATLPDLVDVRGLVVSVVVTLAALVTVMGVFVLELGLLDALGARVLNTGAQALLAALAAVAFHPTTVVLRGVVDQLLFGDRPDPLDAASAVAGRIGDDPLVALRAIRDALVVPYAAVLAGDVPVAASGTETTHTRTLDLDGAGSLVIGLRPGDLSFSPGDEQVLGLVVPLLTQTLRSRAMAEELIESRGQTIAAVEEERRRLRRELHDGLGPRLSGVAFTADAARNLIRDDPGAAEAMVVQLRADTVVAIEEIRRLVYGMRPPALDELGLVPALRQQSTGLRNRSGEPVTVTVTAPAHLPDLPAAVEVAAYRIVTEALANVARHSRSPAALVRVTSSDAGLRLEVTDDGVSPAAWRMGVGLSSMRERAAELGGTLEAGPGPAGGRVAALLPIR